MCGRFANCCAINKSKTMASFRRMEEKRFEQHLISAKCFISNFLVTRPYHPSYLDSARILVYAKECGILIALPSHITKKFTILIYDLFQDEIFWYPTSFPIHYVQIDEAIYSFGRLYFHGTKADRFFICSFDFETQLWSILRYADRTCLLLKSFVSSKNVLQCFLNFCNQRLTIFKIDPNNDVSICRCETVNSPENNFTDCENRRDLFDGCQRLFRIAFVDGIMKTIFALNLLNFTWEKYEIQLNLRFTPSPSVEYWSYSLRNNIIYCYEPMANGTKIWCLNLQCLTDGWWSLPDILSELVIHNDYNTTFDDMYLLCAQKVEPGPQIEEENDQNCMFVDGTMWRYCNLAVKRRFFTVPSLEYFSMVAVCSSIETEKMDEKLDLSVLMLPKIYENCLWNRCNILKMSQFKFSC